MSHGPSGRRAGSRRSKWDRTRVPFSNRLGPRTRYAFVALLGQIAYAAIAFIGSVLAARLLGAAGKGEYTAWTLAAALLVLVLAGAIPVGLGRLQLSGKTSNLPHVLGRHAFAVLALASAISGIGVTAGIDGVPLAACILVSVPAGVVAYDMLVVLQAAKRAWSYHAIRVIQAAVVTAGFIVLTLVDLDDPLAWAYVLFGAGSVLSAGLAWLTGRQMSDAGTPPSMRSLMERGRGSTGANVIDFLSLRGSQFVVIAVAGTAGLGVYSVAINWAETGLYLGHSIGQASFEGRDTLDHRAAERILRRALVLLTIAMIVIAASGWFLITPLFGSEFADARWVLLLLAPGVVARGGAYTSSQILLARGEGSFVTRVLAITTLVGLGGVALATHVYGIEGAAAVSTSLFLVQLWALHRRATRS